MANVSKVLHVSGDTSCFLNNLNIADTDRASLMGAREKVRDCLRKTFAALTKQELGVTVHPGSLRREASHTGRSTTLAGPHRSRWT